MSALYGIPPRAGSIPQGLRTSLFRRSTYHYSVLLGTFPNPQTTQSRTRVEWSAIESIGARIPSEHYKMQLYAHFNYSEKHLYRFPFAAAEHVVPITLTSFEKVSGVPGLDKVGDGIGRNRYLWLWEVN